MIHQAHAVIDIIRPVHVPGIFLLTLLTKEAFYKTYFYNVELVVEVGLNMVHLLVV